MNTRPHAPPLRGSLPPEGADPAWGGPAPDRHSRAQPLRAPFIYLASQSPRRRELLTQWGVRHELLLPDADEDAESLEAVKPNEAPAAYVQRVTGLKLEAAMARLKRRGLPAAPVLCADTTVALGRRILGKPADEGEARRMLAELSGRAHRVLTAVALGKGTRRWAALSVSTVQFDTLTPARIRRYVATGEPMGKAGAYAIQGHAGLWVSGIRGSHTGIIGLPAFETATLLRHAGLPIL